MTYTDEQLKRALAKMLPEKIYLATSSEILTWCDGSIRSGWAVPDTELLHVCWLVEEHLSNLEIDNYWNCLGSIWETTHATWQQRTIALSRVKGVEIV